MVEGELQHHASGCYAAHSGIKRWNRQAENLLLAAEKWAAVGQAAAGQPYPGEDLRRAWKNVLFNQFHDILAGTSLEAAYEDARSQLGEAQSYGRAGTEPGRPGIGLDRWQSPRQPGSHPLIAFNPHAWASPANLELEVRGISPAVILTRPRWAGNALPMGPAPGDGRRLQPDQFFGGTAAPGLRCLPLWWRIDTPAVFPGIQASDTVLENEHLRLEINPESGAICFPARQAAGYRSLSRRRRAGGSDRGPQRHLEPQRL